MTQLTEEIKAQLKEQYGRLYMTVLDNNDTVVWRPIKRSEYREILKSDIDEKKEDDIIMERQEMTCRNCVVFPSQEELAALLEECAGAATAICDQIYMKSGFELKQETSEL